VDTSCGERISDFKTPLPGVFLPNFLRILPEDRGANFAVRAGGKIAALVRQSSGSGSR